MLSRLPVREGNPTTKVLNGRAKDDKFSTSLAIGKADITYPESIIIDILH
jgi:hypothetical protein